MTPEQKARAYDETLERAKKELNACGSQDCDAARQIFRLFPELKESEDEKVRKAIIHFISHTPTVPKGIIGKETMIAWLEKQGKKRPDPYNGISFEYNGHIWGMCARDNGVDISCDKHLIKHLEKQGEKLPVGFYYVNSEGKKFYSDTLKYGLHVEKQGEQRSADTDNKFIRMRETKPKDISEFLDRLTTVEQEFLWEHIAKIRELDKEEQKPDDKVEPKFKVGDYIKHNKANIICKVLSVNAGFYRLINILGGDEMELSNVEKNFHLWTIADAKDGDVLWHSDTASHGTFIFKQIRYDGKVLCYCDYDSEDHFCTGEHHTCCWSSDKCIKPATKEQCDLLFQKMKEVGYEWDSEKKELKKIEPKFKVGDFIANDYCFGKVIALTDDAYLLDTEQGIPFSCEHNTHLWTIADARNGDVLVNWNNTTFIFKAIEDETVKFYIAYNEKWDAIKIPSTKLSHLGLPEPQFEFHLATEEQRSLLFRKMNEAGYEWDVKNQVMTKIEQKSTNSYCQENCKGFQETGKCFADGECKAKKEAEQKSVIKFKTAEESLDTSSDEYNKIVDECLFGEQKLTEFERGLFDMLTDISKPCTADCVKSHSEKLLSIARKMIALEQKPEENKGNVGGISPDWSEEDEINVYNIIHFLEEPSMLENNEPCKKIVIDWLKSLKGRVKSQQKQKWSKEDEYLLNETIQHLEELIRIEKKGIDCDSQYYQRDIDWLKSLRPQNKWKPSDEQMEALWLYAEQNNYDGAVLTSLYNDLKKLKEV